MATRHHKTTLNLNLEFANSPARTQPEKSRRKRVRAQLNRHGWNYKKRCRLDDHAKSIIVPSDVFTPPLPHGGLIRCDTMHVYFINYCTYLLELLSKLADKDKYSEIDNVVQACHQFRSVRFCITCSDVSNHYFYTYVSNSHIFVHVSHDCRDPITGSTHPRLPSVLKMTHLTAERRVRAIFYWAHVLGTTASVMPADCRIPAQVAVASLQLLLIATRGHRAYTLDELNYIFEGIGGQFFKSLEALHEVADRKRMRGGQEAHEKQPNRNRAPLPFRQHKRHLSDSDTCSTDAEKTWGGLGFFEYSQKGLPHCLVHAAEQVMRGGHFGAGDTKTVEAAHKNLIKAASKYSRTYASRNETQDHMLLWVLRQELWKAVVKLNSDNLTGIAPAANSSSDSDDIEMQLVNPLPYTDNWSTACERYDSWGSTFLSKQVLITRAELLTLVAIKLGINPLPRNLKKLKKELTFTSYGGLRIVKGSQPRQFVGISRISPGRRDFVRIRREEELQEDEEEITALSAQVIAQYSHICVFKSHMYVKILSYVCLC